jgi:Intracellular proteinase inhibitor
MRQQHVRPTIESLETRSLLSVMAVELGHHHVGAHAEHVRRDVEHVRKELRHAQKEVHTPTTPASSETGTTSTTTGTTVSPPTGVVSSPTSPTTPSPAPTPSPTPAPTPTLTSPTPGLPTQGTPTSPTTGTPASPVAISVKTNQAVYTPGQTVTMTFTETNDTKSSMRVPIGPSIDGFTVTSGGKTVWRSNSGIEPQYIVLENLAPGASITLTATWTASAVAGTYTVHNQLDPEAASATFEIVASSAVAG